MTPRPRRPLAESERDRAGWINGMFRSGATTCLSILQTDFGQWPPKGLDITLPPTTQAQFATHFKPLSSTFAYVDFASLSGTIHINRAKFLTAAFNKASRDLAETISHENIHVLQKNRMRHGFAEPLTEEKKLEMADFLKKGANSHSRYLCHWDETQARLHEIVSRYHRQFNKIPTSVPELYALLETEQVRTRSSWARHMVWSKEGQAALYKFGSTTHHSGWRKPEPIRDMDRIFASIDSGKRDEYCRDVLPRIYGQLLEIYGDQEGSRRMGYRHNITLTEYFFRQAWALQYRWTENQPTNLHEIQTTIGAMNPAQAEDLVEHLIESQPVIHPVSRRPMELTPDTAWKIIPYLSGRAYPALKMDD